MHRTIIIKRAMRRKLDRSGTVIVSHRHTGILFLGTGLKHRNDLLAEFDRYRVP